MRFTILVCRPTATLRVFGGVIEDQISGKIVKLQLYASIPCALNVDLNLYRKWHALIISLSGLLRYQTQHCAEDELIVGIS